MENYYEPTWDDLPKTDEIECEEEIEEEEEEIKEEEIEEKEGIEEETNELMPKATEKEAEEEILAEEEANKIMFEVFKELNNKNLKEDKLKEIMKDALNMQVDFQKGEILINIAEHPQASIKLIWEIREHISNEIYDSYKRDAYLDQIDKILTTRSLKKLEDIGLKEEDLEKFLKIASTMKTNFNKCEILINIAEHPQAPIELIQEIRQKIFEIDDKDIKEVYLNRIDNFYANKVMELSFDKLNNAMNARIKRKGLTKIVETALTVKIDHQKGEILAKIAEHSRTSIELIREIMWQYYSGKIKDANIIKDNLNRIHKALDKKENRTKIQQIQQLGKCKMALDELSTGSIFVVLD